MGSLPQLSLPHLQVIQGEASTGLVHGVVGDSDACTQKRQHWAHAPSGSAAPPSPSLNPDFPHHRLLDFPCSWASLHAGWHC